MVPPDRNDHISNVLRQSHIPLGCTSRGEPPRQQRSHRQPHAFFHTVLFRNFTPCVLCRVSTPQMYIIFFQIYTL
nr:MAG TPA: hypothetical protein [Caudoviricetes sp.]